MLQKEYSGKRTEATNKTIKDKRKFQEVVLFSLPELKHIFLIYFLFWLVKLKTSKTIIFVHHIRLHKIALQSLLNEKWWASLFGA